MEIKRPVRAEQDPNEEHGYWRVVDVDGSPVLSLCEQRIATEIADALNAQADYPNTDAARWIFLVLEGNPGAKARPRFRSRRSRPYKPDAAEERGVAWQMREQHRGKPLDGRLEVSIAFYRKNRQPIDIDNLGKRALDAAKGVLWNDDRQIETLFLAKRVNPERPRTEIRVEEIG